MTHFIAALSLFGLLQHEESLRPLQTVPAVDLGRYSGTWYEIARYPNRFQKQCTGDVTATYLLLENGDIKIVNRCRGESGEMDEAEGVARKADPEGTNARLRVRFAPALLSFLPFVWGNYWIIDLAPDYTYAVIGEPDRTYLWILARSTSLPEDTYAGILERLKGQGYDPLRLVRTPHTR